MAKRRSKRDEANTPLGREYARLNDWRTPDTSDDFFRRSPSFPGKELTVWSNTVGPTERPLLPPHHGRSNPIVVGDVVLCSTFSPGKVIAFDRESGDQRWAITLGYFGHTLYNPPDSALVYVCSSQRLIAFRPDSGQIAWSYCPYGRKSETIYSSPTVADGRLFIGDRYGYLHCLDAETGERVWQVQPSRAGNNDVNSNPVVRDGVVMVATNAKLAVGFDAASGGRIWRVRLDGPCTNTVTAGADAVLMWTSRSAWLLKINDGTLLGRWGRRNREVDAGCVAGDVTLLLTRRVWGRDRLPWPVSELHAYRGDEEIYCLTYPRSTMATIRYEPATGMVYEATFRGLGILDPATGSRKVVLMDSESEDNFESNHVDQPWYANGLLFIVTGEGRVVALRHP